MSNKRTLKVEGVEINVKQLNEEDYICFTDITKSYENGNALIENWLRNKNTVEFLSI